MIILMFSRSKERSHMDFMIEMIFVVIMGILLLPVSHTKYTVPNRDILKNIKLKLQHLQYAKPHDGLLLPESISQHSSPVDTDNENNNSTFFVDKAELIHQQNVQNKQQQKSTTQQKHHRDSITSSDDDLLDSPRLVKSKRRQYEPLNVIKVVPEKKLVGLIRCQGWGPNCSPVVHEAGGQKHRTNHRPTGNTHTTRYPPRKSTSWVSVPQIRQDTSIQALAEKLSAARENKAIKYADIKKHPFFISGSSWEPGNGKKRTVQPHIIQEHDIDQDNTAGVHHKTKKRGGWMQIDPFNRFNYQNTRTRTKKSHKPALFNTMISNQNQHEHEASKSKLRVKRFIPQWYPPLLVPSLQDYYTNYVSSNIEDGRRTSYYGDIMKRSWPRVDLYNRLLHQYFYGTI